MTTETEMSADLLMLVLGTIANEARQYRKDLVRDFGDRSASMPKRQAESDSAIAAVAAMIARNTELEAVTALKMGVGNGTGNLFVHGDYDSIKAAQAVVFRCGEQARRISELEAAVANLLPYVEHSDSCGDMDAYNNAVVASCGCGLDAVVEQAHETIDAAREEGRNHG